MFPSDVWRAAVFGAVTSAIITLLFVKLWDNQQAAEREKRAEGKISEEHDEPF